MFGFAQPLAKSNLNFRNYYSRLCQHQRRNLGIRTTPFLSYDALFLYICASDARLFKCDMKEQTCCRLRKFSPNDNLTDEKIARFCTNFGMLLVSVKLDDDLQDGNFLTWVRAKSLQYFYRRQIAEARSYFNSNFPKFLPTIANYIKEHATLESQDPNTHSFDSYTSPTAKSFGLAFKLLAESSNNAFSNFFYSIGYEFGSALIAFDCACDWRKDLRNGDYNIVKNPNSAAEAFSYCLNRLESISNICLNAFGEESQSRILILSIKERIQKISQLPRLKRNYLTFKNVCWELLMSGPRFLKFIKNLHKTREPATLYMIDPCSRILCHACLDITCRPVIDPLCDDCCESSGCDKCLSDCGKDCGCQN